MCYYFLKHSRSNGDSAYKDIHHHFLQTQHQRVMRAGDGSFTELQPSCQGSLRSRRRGGGVGRAVVGDLERWIVGKRRGKEEGYGKDEKEGRGGVVVVEMALGHHGVQMVRQVS